MVNEMNSSRSGRAYSQSRSRSEREDARRQRGGADSRRSSRGGGGGGGSWGGGSSRIKCVHAARLFCVRAPGDA